MNIRKAEKEDIAAVAAIYERTHDAAEAGKLRAGWVRGIYPTIKTAEEALERKDLFVLEDGGAICGAGVINQRQMDAYGKAPWENVAREDQVMVLHTLVIDPNKAGRGYGRAFIEFYEKFALEHGAPCLRLDTNEINAAARAMYKKLGYKEIGIIPTDFNGIAGIRLVLLEKLAKRPA